MGIEHYGTNEGSIFVEALGFSGINTGGGLEVTPRVCVLFHSVSLPVDLHHTPS